MTTLPLVDYFMTAPKGGDSAAALSDLQRAADVASAMTQEAIAEYKRLDALDLDLAATAAEGDLDRQASLLIAAAYEEWADRADALLRRVAKLYRKGMSVKNAEELRDAVGRVRGMLGIGAEELDLARAQLRRGEGIPREAVRRELLNRVRP